MNTQDRKPYRLQVRLDGTVYPIKVRPGHWLPRMLRFNGTSIGLTIFLAQPRGGYSLHLIAHELVHALHFVRLRKRIPGRLYWVAVAADLIIYMVEWLRAGCDYRGMPEEVRAYTQQAEVAAGTHPDIEIIWEA